MRHLKSGKKLNRTASHRKATLQSLASNLIEHKRIKTTTAKAKALRPYAEKLISKARHALVNEQNGSLPDGQTIDIHTRRIVARELKRKDILQELFDSIAPVVAEREGGYTRIIKLGARRGDSAEVALIELVDWSNPQEGGSDKPKKKKSSTPKVAPVVAETTKEEVTEEASLVEDVVETAKDAAEVVADAATEVVEDAKETVEEVAEDAKETVEETVEEVKEKVEEIVEEVADKAEEIKDEVTDKDEDSEEEKKD